MARHEKDSSRVTRRDMLRDLAAAGLVVSAPPLNLLGAEPAPNSITEENRRQGTRDWLPQKAQVGPKSSCRATWIEGYCSRRSVRAGEAITFHVSTNPAAPFTLSIYRCGYYGGAGARLVKQFGELKGTRQNDPPVGPKRLRMCEWEAAAELTIPDDWASGVYIGKLTALNGGWQSYVIFIVRDDRPADFVFQCSDNTWQSYNRWPDAFSLYDNGAPGWHWGGGVLVSFHRPYGKYRQLVSTPLSIGAGEWFLWEFPLAYWMESLGYDVTYISNQDTHTDPAGLRRARAFLSVGHDEYWTIEMFRNLQAAVSAGVSAAFLSGNAIFGRIVYSDDLTAFERVGVFGPPGGTREFQQMKTIEHTRPYANELVGAHSTGPVTGAADWTCRMPDHWLFRGSGMKAGDSIAGLVGWEFHGDPALIPGLEIVASGPTFAEGKPNGGEYTATIYPGPKNNFVFNAATIWWADGLSSPPGYLRPKRKDGPRGPDMRVQQITRNLLDGMRAPRSAS